MIVSNRCVVCIPRLPKVGWTTYSSIALLERYSNESQPSRRNQGAKKLGQMALRWGQQAGTAIAIALNAA